MTDNLDKLAFALDKAEQWGLTNPRDVKVLKEMRDEGPMLAADVAELLGSARQDSLSNQPASQVEPNKGEDVVCPLGAINASVAFDGAPMNPLIGESPNRSNVKPSGFATTLAAASPNGLRCRPTP